MHPESASATISRSEVGPSSDDHLVPKFSWTRDVPRRRPDGCRGAAHVVSCSRVNHETTSVVRGSSVPSDPVAARAFLQVRVSTYLTVAFGIWAFAFLCQRVIEALQPMAAASAPVSLYTYVHLATLLILAGLLAVARQGSRSLGVLRSMEVFATFLQGLLSTVLLGDLPLATRPEMLALFAATLFLMLRSGLVPGSTLSAFLVGLLSMLPANVLAWWLYSTRAMVPGSGMTPTSGVFYVAEWTGMALVTTTSIQRVIYGLQERVQELGQYTLLHKIGQGGMGVVYRARHALLRRPTAIKLLPPERTTPSGVARFEREVQLTAELAHPNIVAVYDFGRTPDGSFYYAMEFLDGIDLQRLVEENGPLPVARAVHLLTQAADALAEAHQVGLIHRDIKPANLLVSSKPRRPDHVTVLDFGLAKDFSQSDPGLSSAESITGTPLYMAPESIVDPAQVDARSDVYALGAVAYWLVTGSTPFIGKTIVEICAAHLHTAPEPPSRRVGHELSGEFEAVVLQCLAKNKVDRPPSASALFDRLRAIDSSQWTREEAQRWWDARPSRMPNGARESLELARTMTIARRTLDNHDSSD
jgi:eukaryotic-like serine/threonine-protein kinase